MRTTTRIRWRWTSCAFALACAALHTTHADVDEPGSLQGLGGVMVIVERLHADAEKIGLDRETLDAEVRNRLQQAGIPILSPDERQANERRPYLYINCNVMHLGDADAVAFSLDIEAHQRVRLASGEYAQALTWAKSYLGVQGQDRAAMHIRHVLAGYMNQFVTDYKQANAPTPDPAQPGD